MRPTHERIHNPPRHSPHSRLRRSRRLGAAGDPCGGRRVRPPDGAQREGRGAVEAGAPEFIDLLTSENPEYQLKLGGGFFWLDAACTDRYGSVFMECTPEQKKEIMDLIAFRKNAKQDASLSQGVAFFAFLRNLTTDGFYTSKIGIADLQYIGNTSLRDFPGCPPPPES